MRWPVTVRWSTVESTIATAIHSTSTGGMPIPSVLPIGELILTLITTVLVGHGAGESLQEILFGVLILVFVGAYGREQRVRDRV